MTNPKSVIFKNRQVRLHTSLGEKIFLMRAQIEEELSTITRMTVELLSSDDEIDITPLIGERMRIEVDTGPEEMRFFIGICISVEYFGLHQGHALFHAEIRPWLWFLTQNQNSRVFQNMSTLEIVRQVFSDANFSDDTFEIAFTEDALYHPKRSYCIQYRESDFNFISRLMEEEGYFYFFEYNSDAEKLIIAADASAHPVVEGFSDGIEFFYLEEHFRRDQDHIFEWRGGNKVVPGKMTFADVNYRKGTVSEPVMVTRTIASGTHSFNDREIYQIHGRHSDPERQGEGADDKWGEAMAQARMEALASQHRRTRGQCNVRYMTAGNRFTLTGHPRVRENGDYVVVKATHQLQIDADYDDTEIRASVLGGALDFSTRDDADTYRCVFEAQPVDVQFRPPQATPKPVISGLVTAVVVGPDGDEIPNDPEAIDRVKIWFPWARTSPTDEGASIWVRYSVPWAGNGWGWVGIPRIGHEVLVQFEHGDPDRPTVVGMAYSVKDKPPELKNTQLGLTTNSSKGGGGQHKLLFDDEKGAEKIDFVCEKDYFQVVKNNASISIGYEKNGDTGEGNLTHKIKKDRSDTIEGKHDYTLTGNHTEKILEGNRTTTLDTGNHTTTVTAGTMTKTVKQAIGITSQSGDIDVKAEAGKITIEASVSIELKVGTNTVKIDTSGVTVNGAMIKLASTGMLTMTAGGAGKLQATGMLTVKGSTIMNN